MWFLFISYLSQQPNGCYVYASPGVKTFGKVFSWIFQWIELVHLNWSSCLVSDCWDFLSLIQFLVQRWSYSCFVLWTHTQKTIITVSATACTFRIHLLEMPKFSLPKKETSKWEPGFWGLTQIWDWKLSISRCWYSSCLIFLYVCLYTKHFSLYLLDTRGWEAGG